MSNFCLSSHLSLTNDDTIDFMTKNINIFIFSIKPNSVHIP